MSSCVTCPVNTDFRPRDCGKQSLGLFSCTKVGFRASFLLCLSLLACEIRKPPGWGAKLSERGTMPGSSQAPDSASRLSNLPAPPPGGSPDREYDKCRRLDRSTAGLGVPGLTQLLSRDGDRVRHVTSYDTDHRRRTSNYRSKAYVEVVQQFFLPTQIPSMRRVLLSERLIHPS